MKTFLLTILKNNINSECNFVTASSASPLPPYPAFSHDASLMPHNTVIYLHSYPLDSTEPCILHSSILAATCEAAAPPSLRHFYTKARYRLILGQTASLLPEPPSVICAVKYCHMNSRLHGGQEEAGFTSTPDVSLASAILTRTCSVKWVVLSTRHLSSALV